MQRIELDGSGFTDISRTHTILKEQIGFPDYYGNNLDALWDCLTSWISMPTIIIWYNYEKSYIFLGEYAEKIKKTFVDAQNEIEGLYIEIYNELIEDDEEYYNTCFEVNTKEWRQF